MPLPDTAPAARLHAWFDSLTAEDRDALARRYVEATARGGATMWKPDGRVVPIPPLLTPEVLDTVRLVEIEANAHAILAGLCRLTGWIMTTTEGARLRAKIFRAFGPLEAEGLARTWHEAERLATVRVDYLVEEGGTPRALEVNATIPAMQGYSDIVAEAFLTEVARARAADPSLAARLLDENGRNADQLLESLLAHDRLLDALGEQRAGNGHDARRIVIVHRAGDSQVGELGHLAARWSERGHLTSLATPDEVTVDGHGVLRAGEVRPDIVYRHVFARRLDPASPFARALLEPRRHRILNPIASHLEVKAMLGLLAHAADDEDFGREVGLDEALTNEVRRSVPWTRLLQPGPTRGPSGEAIADLPTTVANEGERFVLKRSWDYGGRGVFLGADFDEGAARRAAEVMGLPRPPTWPELVQAALDDDKDAWVAQGFVYGRRTRHLVASVDGAAWKDLYVDLSVYTNLGVEARPRGGVTRAALGRIVNLQGGGGLAPLLRSEVLAHLVP